MSGRLTRWLARDINAPVFVLALVLALWTVSSGDPYGLRLMTLAGIYALATIGYQFVFGHAGALSLAQGCFFGIGAYVAGMLALNPGVGVETTLPAATLAATVLAALVALPVLRLHSHYFALATLGIGQAVLLLAVNWVSVTGGANGIAGVPSASLLGIPLGRGWPMLLLVWTLVAAAALAARRLTGGWAGPALTLMREQPQAAEAAGIDIGRLRLGGFLLSAGFAGLAGALQLHTIRVVSPEVLEFPVMVSVLTIAVVGGRTSVAGAILGAVLLVHLPEWFRPLQEYYLLAYGVALMLCVAIAPSGLAGAALSLRRRLWTEPSPPLPAPMPVPVAAAPACLEVHGLTRHFGGVAAVDGIDLVVTPGEALGIVGANGSGKSTLLNLIAGAERPDAGSIAWGGRRVHRLSPDRIARAGIARTFQAIKLADGLSALDNVAAGDWRGRDLTRARGAATALLARLGIADIAWQPCGELPPGIRRHVEIARALIARPSLLLLDEPAAGLGAAERETLGSLLMDLHGDGMTLIVVEHDLDFLRRVAGRLVCLSGGRIVADGTPDTVVRHPAVVASWLGSPGAAGGADG